jgi:hypothetical protein
VLEAAAVGEEVAVAEQEAAVAEQEAAGQEVVVVAGDVADPVEQVEEAKIFKTKFSKVKKTYRR